MHVAERINIVHPEEAEGVAAPEFKFFFGQSLFFSGSSQEPKARKIILLHLLGLNGKNEFFPSTR